MDPFTALAAFTLAAALLTLTPGIDTALVLRTAVVEGGRPAMAAGLGIVTGCLIWGFAAAVGLGALLAVSEWGFRALQLAGAAWLLWLGAGMVRRALSRRLPAGVPADLPTEVPAELPADMRHEPPAPGHPGHRPGARWFGRGLLANLLNPKVGVFYMSFLPQFIPAGVPVAAWGTGLAAIHAALGLAWFAALVLATRPLAAWLVRPAVGRGIDGLTGAALLAMGLRLVLERRG
jgi:threonine/homoserine/homoserine lactone efflux protein